MFEIGLGLIVALIIGLAETIKRMGLDAKYIPLLDILLGIGLVMLLSTMQTMAVAEVIFYGIGAGLMACGLFSGVKNVTGN